MRAQSEEDWAQIQLRLRHGEMLTLLLLLGADTGLVWIPNPKKAARLSSAPCCNDWGQWVLSIRKHPTVRSAQYLLAETK